MEFMGKLIKMHKRTDPGETSPNRYIYHTISPLQKTSQKKVPNDYKSQRTKNSVIKDCLLEMTGKLQLCLLNNMAA